MVVPDAEPELSANASVRCELVSQASQSHQKAQTSFVPLPKLRASVFSKPDCTITNAETA